MKFWVFIVNSWFSQLIVNFTHCDAIILPHYLRPDLVPKYKDPDVVGRRLGTPGPEVVMQASPGTTLASSILHLLVPVDHFRAMFCLFNLRILMYSTIKASRDQGS